MSYISHILLGFLMAYIGLVPPGMMNMTAVRMSIVKSLSSGLRFSAGAAFVVIFQAYIALSFAKYLSQHPEVLDTLKKIAVVVFIALAIFFFLQARRKFEAEGKDRKGNEFWAGALMSSMNMLAIPFYFGYSTIMETKGWIVLEQPYITFFVIGAVTGAFALFATYSYFAQTIVKRAQFIASNINYILSGLFVVLAVVQLINLVAG